MRFRAKERGKKKKETEKQRNTQASIKIIYFQDPLLVYSPTFLLTYIAHVPPPPMEEGSNVVSDSRYKINIRQGSYINLNKVSFPTSREKEREGKGSAREKLSAGISSSGLRTVLEFTPPGMHYGHFYENGHHQFAWELVTARQG